MWHILTVCMCEIAYLTLTFIRFAGAHSIKPQYLQLMRPNLPHSTGEDMVDNLICVGYIFVNTNQHANAITLFKLILQYREVQSVLFK